MSAETNSATMCQIYLWICTQPNVESAVSDLEDDVLRDLSRYIEGLVILSGVPRLISGLLLLEAAKRFMNAKEQAKAGGEA